MIKNKIYIKHVSYSNYIGGASIAANNIYISIKKHLKSEFISADDYSKRKNINIKTKIRIFLGRLPKLFFLKNFNQSLSFNLLNSPLLKKIQEQKSKKQIINLHWINRETLSIKDISKINYPLIWTCHDMWPVLGAKHIEFKNTNFKNYSLINRILNLDYLTWKKKIKYLSKKRIIFIVPSKWLKQKIEASKIYKNKKIFVIGNPINTKFWKKIKLINTKKEKIPIIAFGGVGINKDLNKGLKLAIKIFEYLNNNLNFKFKVIFFGDNIPKRKYKFNYESQGYLNKNQMRELYSKTKIVLITSKIESFCQVAAEAQSCEVPIIAYKTSGLNDVIKNKSSGELVNNYNYVLFAKKIKSLLENKELLKKYSKNARRHIVKNYDSKIIAKKYIKIYKNIINNKK
jgi:glycosyltransferase involved in cell wall biosynthesis